MANLGKFQTQDFSFWTGITKDNHISAAFHDQPQKASEFMTQLLAYRRGNTLSTYLSKFPKKMFERDEPYTWDIITSSRRNIPLVEARNIDGSTVTSGNAGIGGEPFYLVFGEHWFNDGDVVVGNLNEVYPIRLLGEPRAEGTNWVHKCELMGGVTTGIPADRLQCGERFSKEYAPVEKELSRGVSDIHFMSGSSLQNEFSRLRIRTKVPGDKFDRKLAVGVEFLDNKTGKKVTMNRWMHYVDYQLEEEFEDDKDNLLMYGRSNRTITGEYLNIGKSGEVIRMGAGIREQTESANWEQYSKFSLKKINDAILNVIENVPRGSVPPTVIVRTGMRGMIQASEAIGDTVSGWKSLFTLNGDNLGVVSKTTSEAHNNALRAGFMFTEFQAPMNCVVKFIVDHSYDDPVRNKLIDPRGGVVNSYRYDFNLVSGGEESNICLCGIKNHDEIRGYMPGLRNPFTGEQMINYMSNDEDACEIHKMWWGGAMVKDPTATYALVPQELVG